MEFQTMPLRFRAWDSEKKKFYKKYGAFPNERLSFSPLKEAWEPQFYEEDEGAEKYIISQDTGLKDKNGKSIFTGDIVRWSISTNKKRYHYVAIVYRDGKVMYDHGSDFGAPIYRYEEVALISEDELVGNIWENPELLEANNGR